MSKVEHDNKEGSNWPWDCEEKLTPDVLSKIVHNLPSYAHDADVLNSKPEEVGMTNSLQGCFQIYCHVVKDHFQKVAENATASNKDKLSEIAEEAFDLIDKLLEYVNKRLNPDPGMTHIPLHYPYSYWELNIKWDTLVRKFDLCMSSGVKNGQDESPLEKNKEKEDIAGPGQANSGNFFELDLNDFNKRSKGCEVGPSMDDILVKMYSSLGDWLSTIKVFEKRGTIELESYLNKALAKATESGRVPNCYDETALKLSGQHAGHDLLRFFVLKCTHCREAFLKGELPPYPWRTPQVVETRGVVAQPRPENEGPPQVKPIPVDEAKLMASAKDEWFNVTPSQVKIIEKLNENPGAWVPGKKLKSFPGSEERPDQIIKRLPLSIRERIESKKGTGGYRLH